MSDEEYIQRWSALLKGRHRAELSEDFVNKAIECFRTAPVPSPMRHRSIPRLALIAASLVLMAGFVFAATVVVDAVMAKDSGGEGTERRVVPNAQESAGSDGSILQKGTKATEETETTATASEADSPTVPKVPLVSSTSTSSTDKQPTFSNSQSENKQGATKMKNQIRTALITAAVTLASVPSAVLGAPEYTIPAPNGVGDVVALTNTLATMETDGASYGLKLWLEPGIYDLRGIKMESGSHLYVRHVRDAVIAGLGSKPEDTVLLGGGENDKCRVAYVTGGGNYWTTTISNLTITGGYADSTSRNGCGGGIHAGNSSVLYDTCIISNNVSMASATANGTRNYGGGGCYLGRARNCLFAGNRTTGSGGGLSTAHRNGANQTLLMASVVDCVFTNNQSSGTCYTTTWNGAEYCGGGGAVCVPSGSTVTGTEFVGNSASSRGGAICVDGGSCEVFGCTFVENASTGKEGGALYGRAAVTNCTFVGNRATDGGAIFATLSSQEGDIVNCHFYGNVGSNNGGAICSKKDTPHVRVFCSDFSRNTAFWGQAAYCADLFDCVVTNHESTIYVLYDCNLMRCRIRNNKVTTFSAALDYSSSIGGCTNVNCEFAFNTSASAAKVSANKTNINCTYADNALPNANYSHITRSCPSYNCIFARNTINGNACDIRAHDMDGDCDLVMTNCLFNKGDSYVRIDANGTANNEGLANCRQVANMKFVDGGYVPTYRSPAYNAGMAYDWILDAIGDGDLAGLPRIFGDGLDIGAYECQMLPPGFSLSIR